MLREVAGFLRVLQKLDAVLKILGSLNEVLKDFQGFLVEIGRSFA
jgi:hypothetical protein